MKPKFYLSMNTETDQAEKLINEEMSIEDRTELVLTQKLKFLDGLAKQVQQENDGQPKVLPVIVCGEDFFEGGNISTSIEEKKGQGHCMPQRQVLHFLNKQMTELSRKYPNILFMPGSVYVEVPALETDHATYSQNAADDKNGVPRVNIKQSAMYVQNIAPVFYQGDWLRMIKKGGFLEVMTPTPEEESPYQTEPIRTEKELAEATSSESIKLLVPQYNEDTLSDLSKGLIFLGKTPLPGEQQLLSELNKKSENFLSPVFEVGNMTFGVEICGDQSNGRLQEYLDSKGKESVDIHVVTSNGIGKNYSSASEFGYHVQADAESTNLTKIYLNNEPLNLTQSSHMKSLYVSAILKNPRSELLEAELKEEGEKEKKFESKSVGTTSTWEETHPSSGKQSSTLASDKKVSLEQAVVEQGKLSSDESTKSNTNDTVVLGHGNKPGYNS